MTIIFGIVAVIATIVAIICATTKKKIDNATKEANKKIAAENQELNNKNFELKKILSEQQKEIDITLAEFFQEEKNFNKLISTKQDQLNSIQSNIKETFENQKSLSNQAFQSWWELLEKNYHDAEDEYNILLKNLKKAYSEEQLHLIAEADKYRKDLDKIRSTRNAAIEAQKREQEIKEKSSFYCLQIPDQDKADILKLNNIKLSLNNPRVLSMLEWSTFIQKPLKALGIKITGSSFPVCGIYKITSLLSGECYIGQSVNIANRFLEHGKCGMDIDRPQGNKLYAAMVRDGIWSFSWEILEICPKDQLDEKEKFYINLYNSCKMGYNSTQGNH